MFKLNYFKNEYNLKKGSEDGYTFVLGEQSCRLSLFIVFDEESVWLYQNKIEERDSDESLIDDCDDE